MDKITQVNQEMRTAVFRLYQRHYTYHMDADTACAMDELTAPIVQLLSATTYTPEDAVRGALQL